MDSRSPKHQITPIFGLTKVVGGHIVLVPDGVAAVAVILVGGVSSEISHQPEAEGPEAVVEGKVIYGKPNHLDSNTPPLSFLASAKVAGGLFL
jgi:hypothetical protein